MVAALPAVNASLNALAATCLVLGWGAIRRRDRVVHARWMVAAFGLSTLFLVSYLVYHSLHGDTPFQGPGPDPARVLLRPDLPTSWSRSPPSP